MLFQTMLWTLIDGCLVHLVATAVNQAVDNNIYQCKHSHEIIRYIFFPKLVFLLSLGSRVCSSEPATASKLKQNLRQALTCKHIYSEITFGSGINHISHSTQQIKMEHFTTNNLLIQCLEEFSKIWWIEHHVLECKAQTVSTGEKHFLSQMDYVKPKLVQLFDTELLQKVKGNDFHLPDASCNVCTL